MSRLIITLIRYTCLKKLGIYSQNKLFDKAMDLVTDEPAFSTKEMVTVMFLLPRLLLRLDETFDSEALNTLLDAIEDSEEEPRKFVELMEIGDIDVSRLLWDVMEDTAKLIPNDFLELRKKVGKNITDESAKEVGQRVCICHPLLTNMLVTDKGVQMPSPSRDIAAVPELMGLQAIVVAVDCDTHKYLCGGCDRKHNADVRIAFDDYNMEFYIDNDFLKPFDESTQN